MRGKKLGRLVGVLLAAAVAVGVTGQAALAAPAKTPPNVPGFNGSTIKLGAITPQSGLASVVGKPLTEGNRVYWDAKNAKGGVGGKYKVDLDIEDSQYQVETALQAYDKIKGDVVAFNQILGTQIMKSILPRLKQDQLTGGPATLDSLWVKEKNLIPIGAPYQVEVANGIDYYLKNGGKGKKICAMAQDDEYGAAGLDGLTQASKTLKFKVSKTVRFATTSDVSAQVGELADAKCDAVTLVSLPNDTGSIVTKMIGRNFTPQIIGTGPTWLTGVKNGDLSKAGIQKAVNQVGTLKFGGLIGDYKYGSSASQRNPSRASTINKIVVGQPIGLQIVAQNLTSQAAKNIKFKG